MHVAGNDAHVTLQVALAMAGVERASQPRGLAKQISLSVPNAATALRPNIGHSRSQFPRSKADIANHNQTGGFLISATPAAANATINLASARRSAGSAMLAFKCSHGTSRPPFSKASAVRTAGVQCQP